MLSCFYLPFAARFFALRNFLHCACQQLLVISILVMIFCNCFRKSVIISSAIFKDFLTLELLLVNIASASRSQCLAGRS